MIPPLRFAGWEWVVGALATPVVFWSGWPFHRAAVLHLRHRSTTMDTLVSMGSLSACLCSAVVLVDRSLGDVAGSGSGVESASGHIYFETGCGDRDADPRRASGLEAQATRRSGDAIRALAELGANTATPRRRHRDPGSTRCRSVCSSWSEAGRPKIATDGRVVDGLLRHRRLDGHRRTGAGGEVGVGDEVIGATINTNGSLVVEATRVGPRHGAGPDHPPSSTRPRESRAEIQRLADRVSSVFVPVAIADRRVRHAGRRGSPLGGATSTMRSPRRSQYSSSPARVRSAWPPRSAIMVGTGRGAQLGVIIKGGEILEDTRAVDVPSCSTRPARSPRVGWRWPDVPGSRSRRCRRAAPAGPGRLGRGSLGAPHRRRPSPRPFAHDDLPPGRPASRTRCRERA